jgi:hypothetical protein
MIFLLIKLVSSRDFFFKLDQIFCNNHLHLIIHNFKITHPTYWLRPPQSSSIAYNAFIFIYLRSFTCILDLLLLSKVYRNLFIIIIRVLINSNIIFKFRSQDLFKVDLNQYIYLSLRLFIKINCIFWKLLGNR